MIFLYILDLGDYRMEIFTSIFNSAFKSSG
jgi:hypothetical protein